MVMISLTLGCSTVVGLSPALIGTPTSAVAASLSTPPACNNNDLLAAYAGGGGESSEDLTLIALINISTSSCHLSGYPTLLGVNRGRNFHLRITSHGTYFGNPFPTDLAPRMAGVLELATAVACPALNSSNSAVVKRNVIADTYSQLVIVLPLNRGRVRVPGASIDTACGLEVSRLGWLKTLNYHIA